MKLPVRQAGEVESRFRLDQLPFSGKFGWFPGSQAWLGFSCVIVPSKAVSSEDSGHAQSKTLARSMKPLKWPGRFGFLVFPGRVVLREAGRIVSVATWRELDGVADVER